MKNLLNRGSSATKPNNNKRNESDNLKHSDPNQKEKEIEQQNPNVDLQPKIDQSQGFIRKVTKNNV